MSTRFKGALTGPESGAEPTDASLDTIVLFARIRQRAWFGPPTVPLAGAGR